MKCQCDVDQSKPCDTCTAKARAWKRVVSGAKPRKLQVDVDMAYLLDLFQQQQGKCALSGIKITLGGRRPRTQTASLDRIDSSRGYVRGNVQWVHKVINIMKLAMSQDDFILWCARVTRTHKRKRKPRRALDSTI